MGRYFNPLNLNISIKNCIFVVLIVFVFFIGFNNVEAASLYFSPSSGSKTVGTTFSVGIFTASTDQAMNAASGIVSFPSSKLEVVSLSKSGSAFNLWVQEPSFSNNSGTINFEGIVLNPGFQGSSGKILTVTFRVKNSGTASVVFSSGSVLANDGNGTNILSTLGEAQFSLKSEGENLIIEDDILIAEEDTLSPKITSETNPNQSKWYQDPDPKFSWNLPSHVTKVQTLVGSRPQSDPVVTYDPPISEKNVTDIPDGEWYFHLRFKDATEWGETTHFKFNIDTENPESFDIREVKREDLTSPVVQFVFDAEDETSGIDHYEINIDEKKKDSWKDDGSHIYTTSVLEPGGHLLIAKAVDRAGNSLEKSLEFEIEPLWPPIIDEYPSKLQKDEILIVKGDARYPNEKVTVWLQRGKGQVKTYEILSDQDDRFIFSAGGGNNMAVSPPRTSINELKSGTYTLWVSVTDERGAKSDFSEKITFVVEGVSLLVIGDWLIRVLTIVVPLIALVALIILMLWFAWHKFGLFKQRIKNEIIEAENRLHKAYNFLRKSVREQIKLLERADSKRVLTKEEEKINKELRQSLVEVEKFIKKEIRDIKKRDR